MKEMTSLERCLAVLRHQPCDRVPVVPQAFLFACQQAGFSLRDMNREAKWMAEAHRLCQEKFGYDGCVIDFDDASLAEACGAKVIYRDEEPAIVDDSEPLLKTLEAIEDIAIPDPPASPRLSHWLEATRLLADAVGDHVFIMGRADQGPFTLACLLRGIQQFMVDLLTVDPAIIKKVIDHCRKICTAFAKAQKDAGAHATSIGDAMASPHLISPETYRTFALEPERQMTREVQAYGIPLSLHICGNTKSIFSDMVLTGASILEIDALIEMGQAKTSCMMRPTSERPVLMGNIHTSDPLVLGTPQQVDRAAQRIIESTRGMGLFLSSGCALGLKQAHYNM
jgi:MtaA/CmuA family methyltransferase